MDLSRIPPGTIVGRLLRAPLKLVAPDAIVPIFSGRLKGTKWVAGSSISGCWLGTYEYEKQKLFSRTITPDSVVFDIGANVGFYTLLSSDLVGQNGKVIAFEPLPRNLSYLHRHLDLNGINNVIVIEAAVSSESGSASFDEGLRPEMGRISSSGALTVKLVTLDELLYREQIPVPQFIKIDIEGAELEALKGARALLARAHPAVFLATHGREVHQECCEFLRGYGYSLVSISDGSPEDARELLAVLKHE